MKLKLDDDLDADDPIHSVVNLIDVFLVVIAALVLAIAANPANPFSQEKVTIIRNPGQPDMEIVIKDGGKVERFAGKGSSGKGEGVKAGSAYRMQDGSIVYVPE